MFESASTTMIRVLAGMLMRKIHLHNGRIILRNSQPWKAGRGIKKPSILAICIWIRFLSLSKVASQKPLILDRQNKRCMKPTIAGHTGRFHPKSCFNVQHPRRPDSKNLISAKLTVSHEVYGGQLFERFGMKEEVEIVPRASSRRNNETGILALLANSEIYGCSSRTTSSTRKDRNPQSLCRAHSNRNNKVS